MLDGFLPDLVNRMAWFAIAFLTGAVPYFVVARRRPDLRRRAKGIYIFVVFVAAMLVADSIHLVPLGETDVGPVIESGRIERPEQGFAVTLPDDWTVHATSPEYSDEVAAEAGVEGLMTVLLEGVDEDAGAGCAVGETTLLMREASLASLDAFIDGTAAEAIDLPAGAAARADHVGQDGRPGTQYTYVEDGEWFALGCYADDPPEDRWLSVAETFEFLPEQE